MAKTVIYDEAKAQNAALVLFDQSGVLGVHGIGAFASIGRTAGQSVNHIQVSSAIVSRSHAEILFVDGQYQYRDLNSTNGTYINDVLMGKNAPSGKVASPLKDGDVLCFDIRQDGKSHPDRVFALFTTHADTEGVWEKLKLSDTIAEICIGRAENAGLQIENEMISEKHASFFCSSNGWAIIDHKSTNGVYLNGKRLKSPRYLEAFDVVRIVNAYFIFTGEYLLYCAGQVNTPAPAHLAAAERFSMGIAAPRTQKTEGQLRIQITERSVFQRFKKLVLLQDINLSVSNGEMVLILGGSGAGKTTFINAVMGYEKASGTIVYQDTDIYDEYEQMKYQIGFVPQQDLLRGSDTVYDTLANAAEMKLPRKMEVEDREKQIEKVLAQLGLSSQKQTLVSKLSGGQRKRLSIAVEFVSDPSLFFLDEPDSGLDDVIGRGLMENLRVIADQGKIVMLITHSPQRAADLFDKVIVLAKSMKDNSGHLAFYGSVQEAYAFFETENFTQILKKINRPDENGDGLSDYYIEKYAAYSKR